MLTLINSYTPSDVGHCMIIYILYKRGKKHKEEMRLA